MYGQDAFFCTKCYCYWKKLERSLIEKTPKKRGRKAVVSTLVKKARLDGTQRSMAAPGDKESVVSYIKQSNYRAVFGKLYSSATSRAALEKFVQKRVKKEVKTMPSKGLFGQNARPNTLSSMNWNRMVEEAEEHMPLLMSVLRAVMPSPEDNNGARLMGGKNKRLAIYCKHKQNIALIHVSFLTILFAKIIFIVTSYNTVILLVQ